MFFNHPFMTPKEEIIAFIGLMAVLAIFVLLGMAIGMSLR